MIAGFLVALLAVMLAGSLPLWPWSRKWGFFGAGGIGVVLLLALALVWQRVL